LRAELTRRLGVRWEQPTNGIAEICDVPDDVLVEFSARTQDIRRRLDDKLDRFSDTMGREATPRERWKLEREAAIDSRPAKARSIDAEVLHAGWAEQVRRLGHDPAALVAQAVNQVVERGEIDRSTRLSMIDQTIVAMSEKQSTWRPTQLHRELAALVPTGTAASAEQLAVWLDDVVGETVTARCVDVSKPVPPDALLRRDGRPATESVADRAVTTQAILDQEQALIDWVDRRLTRDSTDNPDSILGGSKELDVAQAAAAGAVAGDADIVLIVGPAGTGKTTALAPAVAQIQAEGRVVFGVAPSATAAEVLSEETGVAADTLDKLLVEHRLTRRPGTRFDLPAGATVIVDEAGMLPTAKLAALARLADDRGWRIALVGDPLQFSAVGRGGMFGLLVDTFGAIELERVHRFDNEWERDARPAATARRYHRRRPLRTTWTTPRRHSGPDGTTIRRQMVGTAFRRQSSLADDADQRSSRTTQRPLPGHSDPPWRTRHKRAIDNRRSAPDLRRRRDRHQAQRPPTGHRLWGDGQEPRRVDHRPDPSRRVTHRNREVGDRDVAGGVRRRAR